MKRSTDRILTTHVGSLPRPRELMELFKRKAPAEELEPALRAAVAEVVRRQAEAGIDIVNDGEFGKPMSSEIDYGAWALYLWDRVEGYELHEVSSGSLRGKDRDDFAEFYATGAAEVMEGGTFTVGVCVAPLTYSGQAAVERDVDNLKAALEGVPVEAAFVSAVASGMYFPPGGYYGSAEEEATALAEALREEYKAITDAGFAVQIDDPFLVNKFESEFSVDWDLKGFRKWAERHVEIVNHSLEGIPEEQVRYHVCWGSWKGPHSSDLPLKDVVDLMLKINASQYSVEAANPQHEHEWAVWKDVKLPDGKVLQPGVVTHKTNILEHPELVAQRIVRYAEAVGRENVVPSTDCGMGGRIHPQVAWAKLKALSDGAALASKQLWK
jgi:5-methyltetrahydropteroyltriglutamate--homocysteine methyltransferase